MSLIRYTIVLITRVLSLLGAIAVVLAYLLYNFTARTGEQADDTPLPRTAIVFTGAYDRIDLGLELVSSDKIDRLLIAGANRTSGLIKTRYPDLFDPTTQQGQWVESGRIVLAPDSLSTIENALESACWLEQNPDIKDVILITSRRHMARASLALESGIAPVAFHPMISDPSAPYDPDQIDLDEFSKFIATWGITWLPKTLWPGNEPSICKS